MSESAAGSWPEQDIITAWLKENGISIDFKKQMELQEKLTKLRVFYSSQVQDFRNQLHWEMRSGTVDETQDVVFAAGAYGRLHDIVERVPEFLRPVKKQMSVVAPLTSFNADNPRPQDS